MTDAPTATALLTQCDEARRARSWPRLRVTTHGGLIAVCTTHEDEPRVCAETIEESCRKFLALASEHAPEPEGA